LSYGYQLPQSGDRGTIVFDALEDNITQLNSHDHDGTDSDRIDAFSLARSTVAVTSASWNVSGSYFKKTVTFPTGFSVANGSEYTKANIRFFFNGGTYDNQECYPKTNRLTDTTFELFSIVNNQAFDVLFT
jgi:hypothetical protein